ncbi:MULTISPECIES: beta-galactosidase trimerization domain-containing protein [unclassified Streptomyces]|uniref:beta-galactosidase trimerization domain-containing protein n=1 Tax=unclassified Streptomyces TaxID=2593676 RepID=UPI003403E351
MGAGAVSPDGGTRLVEGVLHRDGHPLFCLGVNYFPSRAGCDFWRDWDPDVLDADFARMAALGFNTVRIFVFWADFEPAEGVYDPRMTERLRELADLAHRHKLLCLPSLLTIWMNGQLFDPPWRGGRDLWRDPAMAERQRAFVAHIAGALRHAPNILAYDIGDEIPHVDPAASGSLDAHEVRAWWAGLADAIRAADPGALVLQANEGSAVFGDHAFRPEHARPLDLVALHGFPLWTPFHIESAAAAKATAYLPYLVRRGRVHAPVLVDEMGSYGCDEATAARYLRAAAHSAFAAGAVGIVVWCWQDFTSESKPYALRPGERFVGLLDMDGREKPAMDAFRGFARRVSGELAGFRPVTAPVGVFLPERAPDHDGGYLAAEADTEAAAFYTHCLLQQAHLPYEFIGTEDLERYAMVICPSVQPLPLAAQRRLGEYTVAGGVLLYSTGDVLGPAGLEELFGVHIRDFTLDPAEQDRFTWADTPFPVHWPAGRIPVVDSTIAETLARYPNGTPALTRQQRGSGVAYFLNAPLEALLNAPYRLEETPWHRLYAAIAEKEGIRLEVFADEPLVETTVLARGDERCAVVVNHSTAPVTTTVYGTSPSGDPRAVRHLSLEPKGVALVRRPGEPPLHAGADSGAGEDGQP